MNDAIQLNIRIPPFLFTVFSEYFEVLYPCHNNLEQNPGARNVVCRE